MDKLKIGVIGAGYLGKFHAEKYAHMDDVELVAVVDVDEKVAAEVAGRFDAGAYSRYQDLIGKVDAVSVVVPTPAHYLVSKFLLENDIDILIEKPITTTVEEANELIEIAESRGLVIQVGHLERFNPAVMALKDILSQPLFIESHRLSMYKPRCTDVSVVLDLMIHDIDIILNFVRSPVKSVQAAGIQVISEFIDIANARLEFECGCVANVTASRISLKNERKIRLFQKDAYVSVDFANRGITVIRQNGSGDKGGIIPGMSIHQENFDKVDSLEEELKSFVKAVRRREPCVVTGEMGRAALEIALDINDQIQKGIDCYLGKT